MRSRQLLVAAAASVALAAAGCGSSPPQRPASQAQLQVVSPAPGAVVGGTVHIKFNLVGGTVVPAAQIKGPLRGDQGHIHVSVDDRLVSMAYGTEQDVPGLTPGLHRLQAEFVAIDHLPFKNRVVAPTVLFTVQ